MAIELPDARQLSDEAIHVLRLRALHGIEQGYSEVELADLLGVCHETVSRWWTAYQADGVTALPGGRTGRPLGSGRLLSDEQAKQVQVQIDNHTPEQLGLPHALWTRRAVRDLIHKEFNLDVAERTVGKYLREWGYTSKKPARHARRQDPDEVLQWLEETYPAIEAQAEQEHAEILWTDEVGVEADHHPGSGYARLGEPARLEVPRPHLRVNQISAISNEGTVQFMTYAGMLNATIYLQFLTRLIVGRTRKVLLIADGLRAHWTPAVQAWVEAHRDQIEVFCLPPYAPEMNPVEYMNQDMKGTVNEPGLPADRPTLQERMEGWMGRLAAVPKHVISYFLHPRTHYAAPIELT